MRDLVARGYFIPGGAPRRPHGPSGAPSGPDGPPADPRRHRRTPLNRSSPGMGGPPLLLASAVAIVYTHRIERVAEPNPALCGHTLYLYCEANASSDPLY